MKVTLTPETEKLVVSEVNSGRFRDADAVVAAALSSFSENVLRDAPVYPPGSLLHLYTSKANEDEARTANGNSLEVEGW